MDNIVAAILDTWRNFLIFIVNMNISLNILIRKHLSTFQNYISIEACKVKLLIEML